MQRALLVITGILFIIEFYAYQAVKTVTANSAIRWAYIIFNAVLYIVFLYYLSNFSRSNRNYLPLEILATILLAFLLPKLLISLFLLVDDVSRLFEFGIKKISGAAENYPERRKFLSYLGLGTAGALSLLFLDGEIFGKYRHRARLVRIKIKNLPANFRGYRIVQISDVHIGSFSHAEKLRHAIDLINRQNADLVLFTGDMVNNYADEFKPFVELFSGIKAKDGKLSILGNHDYGDYGDWKSAQEHAQNIPNLIALQKQAGFRMLRNEHVAIDRNGEKLFIIGVENWGEKPFPQYGDLDKATTGIPQNGAKILMSHDPTHFDHVVKMHPSDISLTISGHTHGMQFGIDLKKFRWSPVKYRYPKWADLYESNGKYLYVNRGFGVLAYPGRVGVLPEITVFELS